MNLLEHEYEDNVLRARARERRWRWLIDAAQMGGGAALAVWLAFELRVAWSLVGCVVYVLVRGIVRLRRFIADRGVESASTDREQFDDGPTRLRHAVAVVGIVVACSLLKLVPPLALVALIFASALVVLAVAVVKLREEMKTASAARDERWLDSADSCEIRPRKWSK